MCNCNASGGSGITASRSSRYRYRMGKGVFIHRSDSIYDDSPAERYQFPRQYLSRVSACIGDWIIYYKPSKVRGSKGYFAVAKVAQVSPDPTNKDMFLALIEEAPTWTSSIPCPSTVRSV
jgi:putative restriction endonuclease